jgi:hypothetical protein
MNTLILRIDDLQANGYPISLFEVDQPATAGLPAPTPMPIAPTTIPADLAPPGLAGPLDAGAMRQAFREAQGVDDALGEIGEQLYALLAQNEIAGHLAAIDAGARVLLDIRAPALQTLPWELLRRASDRRLWFSWDQSPFCRGRLTEGEVLAPHGWPLRVMILIGSEPGDQRVQAERELEGIQDALKERDPDIDLLLLKRPAFDTFSRHLDEFQPHIFHFIGHGGIAGSLSGDAYLRRYAGPGAEDTWEAGLLGQAVSRIDPLRLAFVNACLTDADAQQDGLWSVTKAFRQAGARAVIGMRTKVDGGDAAAFSTAFYQQVVAGQPLDVAAARARWTVMQKLQDDGRRREWATPCLEVHGMPGAILSIGQGVPEGHRDRLAAAVDFPDVRRYVDRHLERRRAWCDIKRDEKPPNLVFVTGEQSAGKTSFAQLLMERCVLDGWEVRYVDMSSGGASLGTLLCRIRDGDEAQAGNGNRLLTAGLPDAASAAFNDAAEQVLGAPLQLGTWIDTPEKRRQLVRALQGALEHPQTPRPLVLVLDHLDALSATGELRNYVQDDLLKWCMLRPAHDLVIVALLTGQQRNDLTLTWKEGQVCEIEIGSFRPEEWEDLIIQFLKRNPPKPGQGDITAAQSVRDFVRAYRLMLSGPWRPNRLHEVRRAIVGAIQDQ